MKRAVLVVVLAATAARAQDAEIAPPPAAQLRDDVPLAFDVLEGGALLELDENTVKYFSLRGGLYLNDLASKKLDAEFRAQQYQLAGLKRENAVLEEKTRNAVPVQLVAGGIAVAFIMGVLTAVVVASGGK